MSQSQIQEYFIQQDAKFREIIKKYQLTPEALEALILAPALTMPNVQLFLNDCTKEELANLFYTTGLVKLAEIVEAKQAQHVSHESNPVPPAGSSEAVPHEGQPAGSD